MHASDPSCAACHSVFDGLGFAFENYDAIGRYRTMENGRPIDASGTLTDGSSAAGKPFTNALDLVQLLAGAEQTHRRFPRKLFQSCSRRDPLHGEELDLILARPPF